MPKLDPLANAQKLPVTSLDFKKALASPIKGGEY